MGRGNNERLLTLAHLFERAFERFHDRVALRFRDDQLTYADLGARTGQLASVFRSLGLTADSRVGILMANRPAFLVGHIAAIRAGVTVVPFNSQLTDDEIRTVVTAADLHTILVDETFSDVVHDIQQTTHAFNYVIGYGREDALPIGFHQFERMLDRAPVVSPDVDVRSNDVAALYYSGGTTGEMKGILHGHRQLTLNTLAHVNELDIRGHDCLLVVTPLAHSALPISRAALSQGATIVLEQGFDGTRILQTIADQDVTWTYLVPTMIADLVDEPLLADTDTSSLETVAYGAAPIPRPILERGIEQFGQIFVQFYGLTEVPNLISVLPKSEHDPTNDTALTSAGYPGKLVEIRIRTDAVEWSDEVGEIVVRSPYACLEYANERVGEDEWIPTGDVGFVDEAGRLHVLDRIQDVIIRDGEPVYSTTVEDVIQRHPDVKQVGVIGVPRNGRARDGPPPDQRVKAVIVPQDGSEIVVDDLRPLCTEHTGLDVPDSIDVVGTLPKTPYGKIDKQALRDPYW